MTREARPGEVFEGRDMTHREKIEFMLEREGWAIDAVPANPTFDPPIPTFSYTVGFAPRFGLGELSIFGLTPVACRGLFDLIAGALVGGTDFPVGVAFAGLLDEGRPCAFLPIDPEQNASMFPAITEENSAKGKEPNDFVMYQFAWPDPAGYLPWELEFSKELATVQWLVGQPPNE